MEEAWVEIEKGEEEGMFPTFLVREKGQKWRGTEKALEWNQFWFVDLSYEGKIVR